MNNKNSDFASQAKSSQSQSQVGFIETAIQKIRNQIEFDFFCEQDKPFIEEICLIIAEIYLLPPLSTMQIGKVKIPAWQVKEIFRLIGHDHVEVTVSKYRQIPYRINHVKTYLRTALYNSVFELDAAIENAVHADSIMSG